MLVWQENTCEPHFLHYSKRCPTHAHIVQQGHHRWAPSDDEKVREKKISYLSSLWREQCILVHVAQLLILIPDIIPKAPPRTCCFFFATGVSMYICPLLKRYVVSECLKHVKFSEEEKTAKWKLSPLPLILLSFFHFRILVTCRSHPE